ncbi:hypothetical protein E4U60_006407 [Claviceps pazoutovae]|uniref:DUF6570 domain-containing protein n=1 Tax=Claviceps pazoutovae TaxID=1649127 RepID=A0A9P7MG72_9HYPO|nr:hypothetical protein E4U60_006407 [Claviceps pazoutovae]
MLLVADWMHPLARTADAGCSKIGLTCRRVVPIVPVLRSSVGLDLYMNVHSRDLFDLVQRSTTSANTAENKLNLGVLPAYLPPLDRIEDWLIARAHVRVQICTYRRSQYRHKGHNQHQQIYHCVDSAANSSRDSQADAFNPQTTASSEGPPVMRIPSIRQTHIISFLNDVGTVYDTLPLLP